MISPKSTASTYPTGFSTLRISWAHAVQGFGTKMAVAVALCGTIPTRCLSSAWWIPVVQVIGSVRESWVAPMVLANENLVPTMSSAAMISYKRTSGY